MSGPLSAALQVVMEEDGFPQEEKELTEEPVTGGGMSAASADERTRVVVKSRVSMLPPSSSGT